MKKLFTQKMSCLALGVMLITPQLKADDEKIDFTDLLKNPSFEHFADDNQTPIDVTNTADTRIVSGALRGTPPGWLDTGVNPPATGNLSYGINRNAIGKNGFNSSWCAANPFPATFALYQEVDGLPAGQYVISCRMWVSSARLTSQRLFVQTKNGENITNNIVQYFGKETDYVLNLTEGETNTYAEWEMTTGVGDGDSRLKPMSITVNVAQGERVILGVKSGNVKGDGTVTADQQGFVKYDDFRITKVVAANPNDYTSSITNPSFEQVLIDNVPTQLKTFNIPAYSATDPQRGVPYGWSNIIDDSLNPVPDNNIGQSYGVNSDANGIDGAKHMWVMRTPFVSSYTLYQDITGLTPGKYQVSCSMFVQDGCLGTQRLFANNKVQYYGTELDYSLNLTDGEVNTFAGYTTSPNAFQNGFFLKDLSVDVEVRANETLRLGIKSGNMKADGTMATGTNGWFKADNFKLIRIGDLTDIKNTDAVDFSAIGQKNGISLTFDKNTTASIKVITLSGQSVYESKIDATKSWISLPQGLYILQVNANGKSNAVKVAVK